MNKISAQTAFKIYLVFCLGGALLSLYLLVHHLQARLGLINGQSFCSLNEFFDCDKVAASSYSEFLRIPVAGYGLFYYAVNILILRLLKEESGEGETWSLLKVISLLGIVPVVILACISIVIIRSVCIVCFASYLCTVALGVLSFRFGVQEQNFFVRGIKRFFKLLGERRQLIGGIAASAIIALIVPGVVIFRHQKEFPTLQTSNEIRAVEQWQNAEAKRESQLFVMDGPERDVFFGDPQSKVSVVSYSDMACPHCKVITKALHGLAEKYPIKLVIKDYPLDRHCNPAIKKPFHETSCHAAKIGRCALLTSEELYTNVHNDLYLLEVVSPETVKSMADLVQGSSPEAAKCMKDPSYPASLARHIGEGTALNIPGTPALFVNGKLVTVPTVSVLEKIIRIATGS